ncbi:hypothetical protein Tco_0915728, partial [Tanacetum coccineum]
PPLSSSLSVSSGFGDQFLKLSSDSSLVSTVKDSADADVSSLLDIPIQHETPQIQSPSVQKIPVSVIPEITNLPPIPKIVTETPVTSVVTSSQVTPIISTIQQTSTLIPTPTITTDASIITTDVPESNALTAVELRVSKLEKDVYELKTVDHSSKALVVLQSYVPTLFDSYLDTKVRDVFQKDLQKHTTYLIHKYSLQHLSELTKYLTPTSEQESEQSPSEILKIKKEQAESQKNLQFTIKSTDKAVADTVKDHKRKHDDDEDDDDEDPLARSNQGSKTGKSASTKEPTEEPIVEVIMDDAGVAHDDNPPQDTSEPKTRKTLNPKWFKQPPRPPTPDPEWNKRQVVLDQPAHTWFNQMASALKDPPTFNDLMDTPIYFSKYVLNGLKIENLTQDILLGPADAVVVRDFYKKFYNSIGRVPNRCSSSSIGKTREGDFVDLQLNDFERYALSCCSNTSYCPPQTARAWCRGVYRKKKLNITKPQKPFPEIEFKEPYTPSYDPLGIIYEDLDKQKRVL